ncbi:MAG: hypothetical protein PVG45_05780 [Gammaproteobacteria bacterium]|jgi:hypothetical protein
MGKKKDKAEKSRKEKHRAESVPESASEATQPAESEVENAQYEEYVTATDVMALINSLEQGLERLDQSNQMLKQQIAHNQTTRQHDTLLRFLTFIIAMGVIVIAFYNIRINDHPDEMVDSLSNRLDSVTAQTEAMNISISVMANDLNSFNSSLELLSANISTINQNINKVAGDVSRINTGVTGNAYDSRYYTHPQDSRQLWR